MCERNTFKITDVVTGGDHTDIGSGTTCGPCTLAPYAHQVKPFTEYPECSSSENSTKAYRDVKQKASAAYSLSIVKATSMSHAADSKYSQRGSDSAVRCGRTLRIDPIVNTNKSRRGAGTHVYNPHLPDISSTSSNACKAGALVPSPPCLGEGPHGWVPVDTHNAPVLTTVRRLWVAYVLYEPNVPQEHEQPAHLFSKKKKNPFLKKKPFFFLKKKPYLNKKTLFKKKTFC